jgi:hypothetical protein
VVWAFGAIDLVDAEGGLIDRVNVGLLLDDKARVLSVVSEMTALRRLAGNGEAGVVNAVASVDLKRSLVGNHIQLDARVDTP